MRPIDRLTVLDFTSMNDGAINLLNSGDVDILVSQIDFFCPELGLFQSYPLNQVAKKHELLTLKIRTGTEGELIQVGPDQWQNAVSEVKAKGLASGFIPAFFSRNSPLLFSINHVENIHFVNGSSRIYYVPVSMGQTKTLDLSPISVVLLKKK